MTTAPVFQILTTLVITFGISLTAQAQEQTWAAKMFDTKRVDFGVVAKGADTRHRIIVTNLYKEAVHISNIRTTCGCTAAKPSTNHLASKETAFIEITMNTNRFSRRKDSNLIVTFDAPLYAEVRIPVTAYIRTDVVLRPGAANFGAVDQGVESNRRIEIEYQGRSNWTIRDVQVKNEHLTAKIVEKSRYGGRVNYELHVSIKPTAPPGYLRDQIILVTDDARNPHVPVLVQAKVESDVTVTPSQISFGRLPSGKIKTVNIVVRGKKPFAIEKVECDSASKAFSVRLSKATKQVHVLPITFTATDDAGKFAEVFSLTITGRPEPVTFKASGQIIAATTAVN